MPPLLNLLPGASIYSLIIRQICGNVSALGTPVRRRLINEAV